MFILILGIICLMMFFILDCPAETKRYMNYLRDREATRKIIADFDSKIKHIADGGE